MKRCSIKNWLILSSQSLMPAYLWGDWTLVFASTEDGCSMETLYRKVNIRITWSHLSTQPAHDATQVAASSSGCRSVILVQRKLEDQVTTLCNRLCQSTIISVCFVWFGLPPWLLLGWKVIFYRKEYGYRRLEHDVMSATSNHDFVS